MSWQESLILSSERKNKKKGQEKNFMKQLTKLFIAILLVSIGVFNVLTHVQADQNISVTGTVPPQATDFQTTIDANTHATIPESTVVTYTLTYGSHLYYAGQMTVEAYWDQGTVNGSSSPSVDGLDYVTGSATKAYNNTTPVVDLVNNKIDWTISSFPAQTTNQTVTFQLRTNTAYTGDESVTFPIQVKLIAPHFTTAPESVITSYQFDPTFLPTPTPTLIPTATPAPTATPVPGPTATPAPALPTPTPTLPSTTPAPKNPTNSSAFSDITIVNLTNNESDISFIVKQAGTVQLLVGTSPQALSPKTTIKTTGSGIMNLPDLLPQTLYYFQLISTGDSGIFSSEIFSLRTPPVGQLAEVATPSLVITADNDVLYSLTLNNSTNGGLTNPTNQVPTVPVASTTNYNFSFKLTKSQDIKTVQVILQNISVLGIASPAFAQAASPMTYTFSAFDKGNGIYVANITNNLPPGIYSASIRVQANNGAITTQKVANIHVLHPFRAYDAKNKKPLSDVRITLFRWDANLKKYLILQANTLKNPIYTSLTGDINEQLPSGRYQARYMLLGYKSQTVTFTLGSSPNDDYPSVSLQPTAITLNSILTYYKDALGDWISINNAYINELKQTYRFYNLFGILSIFCLVSLTLMFFSLKTHISLTKLHMYFHHHLLKRVIKESPYVSGQIVDKETKKPLSDATISLVDEGRRVFYQTRSDKKGDFLLPSKLASAYMLLIVKLGYEEKIEHSDETHITITLQANNKLLQGDIIIFLHTIEAIISAIFAFLLIFSLLLELVLVSAFGVSQTAPFLIISLLNLILWVFYIQEKHTETL